MATRDGFPETTWGDWAWRIIVFAVIANGLYKCAFEPKPEPESCGPHHHIHVVGQQRTGYDVDDDLACIEDHRWACMQAANSLTDKEFAVLGCPSKEVLWNEAK